MQKESNANKAFSVRKILIGPHPLTIHVYKIQRALLLQLICSVQIWDFFTAYCEKQITSSRLQIELRNGILCGN